MKILITGSEGYIGSVLCPALEAKGHQVKKFDKVLGDDVTNIVAVRKAAEGVDLIVHLAAIVGLSSCEKDADLAQRVNVTGTANIVSCGKRVVFTSALSHYGTAATVTEKTPVSPKTVYSRTKIEAETRVLAAKGSAILRLGALYGLSPRMRDDTLVHSFCREAVERGKITLFQPDYVRAITNIEDAVKALIFFASREEGGIYNIVSANVSKGKIAKIVQEVTNCDIEYIRGEDEEDRNYFASTDKVQSLGFEFHPELEKSIREIVEYYRSNNQG